MGSSEKRGENWKTTVGQHDGYRPNLGTSPQAEYTADLERQAAAAKMSRGARLRRALRRLFWEF